MSTEIYEQVNIEDMDWDDDEEKYTYYCPCGDLFEISLQDLEDGEVIAHCPSCTLVIMVIYDQEDFLPPSDEDRFLTPGITA